MAVILMIMQKPRDLSLWRGCPREVGEGSRVFEEFPLDFGRKSAPSHNDGRSQTFEDLLVVPGSGIKFSLPPPSLPSPADVNAPPSSSHRAIAAA